ncbi:MAG: transketolase [Anaerolineaceae bacterium]
MADSTEIKELEHLALKCRRKVLRMVRASGHGHLGGAFSCIDIVTALYFHTMNVYPQNPLLEERDRFVLSAGHKCMAQYAVLAERGYFEEEILDTYGQLKSRLPGHPDMHKLPGIEANTGALGHGLSISVGMALGLRADKKASRVFTITGDGELPEGSNWEAAAAASHYGLDNFNVFVDNNGLQISGRTVDIMNMQPIAERFHAFGWETAEIDGNNMTEVVSVLDSLPLKLGKPSLIVAHTVKSKGLSFAEDKAEFHYWKPSLDELQQAENELDQMLESERWL